MAEAYIVEALRTPAVSARALLAGIHPADLGGSVLDALVACSGIDPAAVEENAFMRHGSSEAVLSYSRSRLAAAHITSALRPLLQSCRPARPARPKTQLRRRSIANKRLSEALSGSRTLPWGEKPRPASKLCEARLAGAVIATLGGVLSAIVPTAVFMSLWISASVRACP